MEGLFTLFIIVAVLGAIAFVAKIVFVVFLVKKGIDAYAAHQQAFDQAIRQQHMLLQQLPRGGGGSGPSPQMVSQIQAHFWKAQNEMRQLDDLRRQQSELRMTEMTGQLAEAGIFINPSSL